MLIALDVPVVDVQRRLGHRKPDTTLRVDTHQWKEREARRSQIGRQLGQLFDQRGTPPAPAPGETRPAYRQRRRATHEGAVTVHELIDELESRDPDTEVRFPGAALLAIRAHDRSRR
jgi:hypothetical protein